MYASFGYVSGPFLYKAKQQPLASIACPAPAPWCGVIACAYRTFQYEFLIREQVQLHSQRLRPVPHCQQRKREEDGAGG